MSVDVSEPQPGVTLVTLSNPAKRNAFDEATFRQLAELWPSLEASRTRCIVITGDAGHFSSGADLSANLGSLPHIDTLIDAALLKTRAFKKPLVAAIEGVCIAGGLELALSCDVRFCAADSRFGFPEAKWGIFPAGGAAQRLAGELGYAAAAELLLTGRLFDAAEAVRLGLVNEVIEDRPVVDRALRAASSIAANSPAAVEAIKAYLSAARTPPGRLLALERRLATDVRASGDANEGLSAFREKRPPLYSD
jgi:enoyl-CoA hydratase/carnithine racemase